MNALSKGILLFLLILPLVSAHGFENSQECVVDGVRFEFGATDAAPAVGERVGMSFSVDNVSTNETIPVDGLWVRISQGNDILFASADFRTTNATVAAMDFIFPKPGVYDIDVATPERRTTFQLPVHDTLAHPTLLWSMLALVAGVVLGLLLYRFRGKHR